jgi:hypothetical protein
MEWAQHPLADGMGRFTPIPDQICRSDPESGPNLGVFALGVALGRLWRNIR